MSTFKILNKYQYKKNERKYKKLAMMIMLKALVEKEDNMQKQMGYFSGKIDMIKDIKARNKISILSKINNYFYILIVEWTQSR